MLTLAHPWAFALLPFPLVVRWLLPAYREARAALRIPTFVTLSEFSGRPASDSGAVRHRSMAQAVLFVAVWVAAVAALARPQLLEPPIVRQTPTRDLLLAVDLSGSMETKDFSSKAGKQVDRLDAVKEVLDEFLTRRRGDRIALIVFGSAAYVQVPFTEDVEVVRTMLADLAPRMAGPKTAFGDAIGLAITLFERSQVDQRVLIALTDGNDTGSRIPPQEAARIAADDHITIYAVAVGDPTAVGEEKLDEAALRAVAATTDGRYFFAADRAALGEIYAEIDRIETHQIETVSHRPLRELFHWPLALILVLALTYHAVAAAAVFLATNEPAGETEPR